MCLNDLLIPTLIVLVREAVMTDFTGRKFERGKETCLRSDSKSRMGNRAKLFRSQSLVADSAIKPNSFLISLHLNLHH